MREHVDKSGWNSPNSIIWIIFRPANKLRTREKFSGDIVNVTFLYQNCYIFLIKISVCSLSSTRQQVRIGSYNRFASNKHRAIIWANDGLVCWLINALLGWNYFIAINQNYIYSSINWYVLHLKKYAYSSHYFVRFTIYQYSSEFHVEPHGSTVLEYKQHKAKQNKTVRLHRRMYARK